MRQLSERFGISDAIESLGVAGGHQSLADYSNFFIVNSIFGNLFAERKGGVGKENRSGTNRSGGNIFVSLSLTNIEAIYSRLGQVDMFRNKKLDYTSRP